MDRAMVFGKYCLLERISVGGMAEVFRAKPLPAHQSDKMLALKRILPHLAEDDEFITMFVDEAKLTVQLEHPNIVETYELGNFQSSYYILMEYIAGEDVLELQKRLRQNRRIMSVAQACYVAANVARGLHYAHTACDEQGRPYNIIHRDVSPQNIRLTWDGRVKLIDFGIAKAAVQRTKTQVGVLKGKFGYMSPEQVRGDRIDHRSDVFALGTTFWEMLTNRRLFNGENEYETLQMVKHPDIPAPSEKNSQVPQAVDDIVMRALHEDRERRFQSGLELAEALEGFLQSLYTPYTQRHLAEWMADTFSEELADERRKRELFRQIKTTDDVRWFNREYADSPAQTEEVSGESLVHDDESEDQIWDPEFAPEEGEEVDQETFAAEHTMVAAGGFDPAKFEDEEDDLITLADDDIIEIEDEEELQREDAGPSSRDAQPAGEARRTERRGEVAGTSRDAGEGADGRSAAARPDRSTTGADRVAQTDGPGGSTEERDDTMARFAFAAAAVIAVLVLGFSVVYLGFMAGPERRVAGGKGALVIDVEPQPTEGGTILVDGEPRGERAPAAISSLEPRKHSVEIRYPEYQPVTKEVDLSSGALETLTVELEPKEEAQGRIRLTVPEVSGEVRIFVDGERRTWNGESVELKVEPGRHLVEAVAPKKRPWSRVVEVGGPGEAVDARVEWRERALRLGFESESTAVVTFDGEELGTTPVTAHDVRADEIHRVEFEETDGRESWESKLGFPEIGWSTLAVSFDDEPPSYDEREFGWLTVSTGGTWWSVTVDRAPTGLITPIESDAKIPVREGERTVTLRRGNREHEFEIEIEGGETTSLVKKVPFEWSDTGM